MMQTYGALLQDPTFLSLTKLNSGQPTSSPVQGAAGGLSPVRSVLPGLPTSTDERILSQTGPGRQNLASPLEALIPDPAIYKFETGTGYEIQPVISPDGQSVVFHFNYMYTTDVREPVRADEKHLGRVKRHFIDTDVQLGNYELREISRYVVALKASRTSRGVPLPVLTRNAIDGRVLVDIPPTALVHRYYYTGDRSLQAGLLPGGPCVVVASHPKTGEQVYVPVQLPPGAPRVTYTADGIEYDYGTQAVTVSFCCLFHDQPKVTYRQSVPLTNQVEGAARGACNATRRLVARTGVPECADKLAAGTKSFVLTSIDRANGVGTFIAGPPTALIKATPLGNLFTESPEDLAQKDRAVQLNRVQDQAIRQADAFIKSNR